MTRSILFLSVIALLAIPAGAQNGAALVQQGRALIDAGHMTGNADSLMAARATLAIAAQSDDAETASWAAYYSALADYRLAYQFWARDVERALQHAEAGAEALAPVLSNGSLPAALRAEAHALNGSLLGAQMGLDQARGMSLGMTAQQSTATSLRLAPDNPRVLFQSATALINTPPEWGGDRAEAIRQLDRAVASFEPSAGLAPSWGEDEAHAWLGMAHLMDNDPVAARPAIERAAELNPASEFVQYKLMPWLQQVEQTSTESTDS